MVNPIVKAQLAQCRIAKVPDISDDSEYIMISKSDTSTPLGVSIGEVYLIEMEDYCLSQTFDFHKTWNNGKVPTTKYLKVCITDIKERMICFDGAGTNYAGDMNTKDIYLGYWLPTKSIRILRKIS